MTPTVPIRQATQFLTDPEAVAMVTPQADPAEDRALAEVEEEEVAELWANDPGNRGA